MPQFFYPDLEKITADNSETARYLGYKKLDTPQEEVSKLIEECSQKMHKILQPRATYDFFDLTLKANGDRPLIQFADLSFESVDLGRNLTDCKKLAIFAATIGPQVDALIRKTEIISPVEAAVLQATGAMYIEQVVELMNEKIRAEAEAQGYKTRPRYSPGYGDVPLTMQKDFFRLLPCTRIGLSLMDTLIMSPEKSVTAFVGIL